MGWRIVSSTGQYTASKSGVTSRNWAATIVTFKTENTISSSLVNLLLGRPTNNSIAINAIVDLDGQAYFEYGTESGNYTGQTSTVSVTSG